MLSLFFTSSLQSLQGCYEVSLEPFLLQAEQLHLTACLLQPSAHVFGPLLASLQQILILPILGLRAGCNTTHTKLRQPQQSHHDTLNKYARWCRNKPETTAPTGLQTTIEHLRYILTYQTMNARNYKTNKQNSCPFKKEKKNQKPKQPKEKQ